MAMPEIENAERRSDLAAMTAEDLLAEAQAAGLTVQARDGRLIVRGPSMTEPELVRALLDSKAELMPVLLSLTPADLVTFDERAAIAEYDGGLSRADAERLAWAELDRQWRQTGTCNEVVPEKSP